MGWKTKQTFSKEDIDGQQAYENVLNIINY